MRRTAVILVGLTTLAFSGLGMAAAHADKPPKPPKVTTCTSTLGPGTFHDVVVPSGVECIIAGGTVIQHDLTADNPLLLVLGNDVGDPVQIGHDMTVTITGPSEDILVCNTAVRHNLTVTGGASSTGIGGTDGCASSVGHDLSVLGAQDLEIRTVTVGHNLTGDGNVGFSFEVDDNTVGHNLDAEDNNAPFTEIARNTAGHDLVAEDNNASSIEIIQNTADHDVLISGNHASSVHAGENSANHDALCSDNESFSGNGNTAGHQNTCNS